MKKFVKYTAITALVLVVVGVVMLSIGAIGGSVQGIKVMDEVVEKVKAGEFSIDAEDLEDMGIEVEEWLEDLGIDAQYSVNTNIKFNENHAIFNGGNVKLDFEAEGVKKLVISLAACDVEIKTYEGDRLCVDAEYVGKMQAFIESETLYVIAAKSGVNVSAGDFEIKVPEGMVFEDVKMDFGAGSIDVSELHGGEVMVSVGAGEFNAKKLEANSVVLSVGAGDATIRDGVLGDVKADVGAGNIDITAQITGNVDGDVALGNLSMVVKGGSQKDYNYNIDCSMGEVNVGEYSWAGLATSDTFINNDAATTFEFDCAMGNIDVRFVE